jgi:capsular exopolysaccharide synthesis family protein
MPANADNVIHFSEYFKVVRTRLWVIITIFLLTLVSGWYVTTEVLPKIYSATAQIQIQPRGEVSVPTIDSAQTDKPFDSVSFQAEFEIMQSPNVLLPIINDLQLNQKWAVREKAPEDKLSDQDALAYMQKVMKLDYKRGTDIVEITASSEEPKEAADIANALAIRYKAMRDDEQTARNNSGAASLRDQITQQQAVVADAVANVEKLRKQASDEGYDIVNGTDGMIGQVDRDLESRKKDLLAAQQDYDARRVLLDSVQNLPDDQFISTLVALNHNEPEIETLRTESFKTESDIDNMLKDGFDQNHPRVQALQAELDRTKQQITELIAGERRGLAVDTDMAKSRVALLQAQVDDLTKKSHDEQTSALVPFREAQRELDRQRSLLDAFNVRLKGAETDQPLFESPVRIISNADIPEAPSSPKKALDMGISAAAGLAVGLAVAFLIEYLDTSVKTMADAESLLGLPVLTVIPNKGGPMPLVQDSSRLPHAEGYRILRAKLDLKVQNGIGPSISMLSGGPGEGKSTTIYNLAVVCAQAGQSVILVDCDLRRPTLHDLLDITNDFGLSNFLRGEGDLTAYIQQTALEKLHVMTAGDMPIAEIGVLAGDKIRLLLDELKQRYDVVLIDSPPVLGISDGSIIAREVDYVILVIQHRRYPREISLRAKRAIAEVHGNCVGMVLNCVSVKSDDAYYYYSSYGNYYKKADRAKKKRRTKVAVGANGKHAVGSSRKTSLESDEF